MGVENAVTDASEFKRMAVIEAELSYGLAGELAGLDAIEEDTNGARGEDPNADGNDRGQAVEECGAHD